MITCLVLKLRSSAIAMCKLHRISGGGSVTITASWIRPPNYELFDIDRYDINVSSTSGVQDMTTAYGECTNSTVTVAENPMPVVCTRVPPSPSQPETVRCGKNGPAANASYSYTLSKFWDVF